jgi:arsenite-transporting ATPase
MFAGKGGVGKTTCAATTALHLSSQGRRTLIISTDPSPSIADIFETRSDGNRVEVLKDLYLEEIRLDDVRQRWKKKFGAEVYEVISAYIPIGPDFLDYFADAPGIGNEFMLDYIRELVDSKEFEYVVWDTAPGGHTLNLLKLPEQFIYHMNAAVKAYSRLKKGHESGRSIFAILNGWKQLSQKVLDFLRSSTDFILVTIPESLSLIQTENILEELGKHGFAVRQIIINNVVPCGGGDFLKKRCEMQQGYIQQFVNTYGSSMQISQLHQLPGEVKGLASLRELEKMLFGDGC